MWNALSFRLFAGDVSVRNTTRLKTHAAITGTNGSNRNHRAHRLPLRASAGSGVGAASGAISGAGSHATFSSDRINATGRDPTTLTARRLESTLAHRAPPRRRHV